MRARVDCRLGSVFDSVCDLLVIPSSTERTIIENAGLPLPSAMGLGTVRVHVSKNPRYKAVAYAALASVTSSQAMVEEIGRDLGRIAYAARFKKIEAPILGSGSGSDLSYPEAAAALARGFQETGPESAMLMISVPEQRLVPLVTRHLLGLAPVDDPDPRPKRTGGFTKVRKLMRQLGQSPESRRPTSRSTAATKPVTPPPPSTAPRAPRTQVFISYSHADKEWLVRLQKHLRPLVRTGLEVWDDTRLRPGEPWREEIRKALAETKVAILLISADFLASDFIATDELPPLLEAAANDGAIIMPVIVGPSLFEQMESLSRFQAVNDPRKPLVKLSRGNRDDELVKVARAVAEALKR